MLENSNFLENKEFSLPSDEIKKQKLNMNLHIRFFICVIFATSGFFVPFIFVFGGKNPTDNVEISKTYTGLH